MSLPPQTIRVKRSRNEDPVQALYIEKEHKRRRFHENEPGFKPQKEYIFRLSRTVENISTATPSPEPVLNNLNDPLFNTVLTPPTPRHVVKELEIPGTVNLEDTGTSPSRNANHSKSQEEKPHVRSTLQVSSGGRSRSPAGRQLKTPVSKLANTNALSRREAGSKDGIKRGISPSGITKARRRPGPVQKQRSTQAVQSQSIGNDKSANTDVRSEVRRFHLSRQVRFNSNSFTRGRKRDRGLIPIFMENTGRVAKKRSVGHLNEQETGDGIEGFSDADDEGVTGGKKMQVPETVQRIRRKPRTHPKEKELYQEKKDKAPPTIVEPNDKPDSEAFDFGGDELASQLQAMVLDYISSQPAIQNLPATKQSPVVSPRQKKLTERMGGGVGGGTWEDIEKEMNLSRTNMNQSKADEDMDEEWVYDVYVREEIETDANFSELKATEKGNIGVLVITSSDDEQWWYENAEDDNDSDSKAWDSDDQDSNAEDFFTNDYPDEEDDNEFNVHSDDDGDVIRRKTGIDTRDAEEDEEYNIADHDEDQFEHGHPDHEPGYRGRGWNLPY